MFWSKDLFVLRNDTSFGTLYRNLSINGNHIYAKQLSSIKFPIKVTKCDNGGVGEFIDARGVLYGNAQSYFFDNADRDLFKKVNVATVEKKDDVDLQSLLDSAHLLGVISVAGTRVNKKKGDLENYLRKSRASVIKHLEKKVASTSEVLKEYEAELKEVRGE